MCGTDNTIVTDLGTIPCTPSGFAQAIYSVGLAFIGTIALVFIVYGGYLILTSQGSPDQISRGRSYITYAIIGAVLAVAGYALYQIVILNVLKLPGFKG